MTDWNKWKDEAEELKDRGSQANRDIRGWWAARSEKQRRVIRVVLVLAAFVVVALVAR